MSDDHYRRLERMYHSAPINAFFRPTILVGEGRAEVALEVRREMHHAAHALHGSVYFKSLDDAAFFAAQSAVPEVFILTVNFNLVLLRPVTEGVITAVGRLVHTTRSLLVAESELVDAAGKMLARGSGTFMRGKTVLDASVGYL